MGAKDAVARSPGRDAPLTTVAMTRAATFFASPGRESFVRFVMLANQPVRRRNPETIPMPKFMLILRADVTTDYSQFTPDDFQQILGEYRAWGERMTAEGRLELSRKLTDQGGKVIWPRGRKTEVKDGPYAETKEVVGGAYVLKADSYEHAVRLCDGHPNLRFGSIEVRELDFMGGPEQ